MEKVLSQTAKQKKFEPALHRYQALKHWQEVAGEFLTEAKELTRATDLKNGILHIACLSKEIAYQLKLLASRIIYALNQAIGKNIIRAIQVEV